MNNIARFLTRALEWGIAVGILAVVVCRVIFSGDPLPETTAELLLSLLFAVLFLAAFIWAWRVDAFSRLLQGRYALSVLLALVFLSRTAVFLFFRGAEPVYDSIRYTDIASLMIEQFSSVRGLSSGIGIALWCAVLAVAILLYLRFVRKHPSVVRFFGRTAVRLVPLCLLAAIAFFSYLVANRVIPGIDYFLSPAFPEASESIFAAYIATFPHFIGYPLIVTLANTMLFSPVSAFTTAQLLNIVLSVLCGFLVYRIAENIWRREAGAAALLLYLLWPSQLFAPAIPLAELTYQFFLLAALCLASSLCKKTFFSLSYALTAIYSGLSIALASFIRPVGVILLIALFIWFAVTVCLRLAKDKPARKRVIPRAVALLFLLFLFYTGLGSTSRLLTMKAIGREPALFAMGWNVFDGSNFDAVGTWNGEDNAVFTPLYEQVIAGEIPPDELHHTLFDLGKERLMASPGKTAELFSKKILFMWSFDKWPLTYLAMMKPSALSLAGTAYLLLTSVANGWYLAALVSLVFFLFTRPRETEEGPALFPFSNVLILYVIGTVLGHMLMEQSQRYAFPAMSLFAMLLAGYAVTRRGGATDGTATN